MKINNQQPCIFHLGIYLCILFDKSVFFNAIPGNELKVSHMGYTTEKILGSIFFVFYLKSEKETKTYR